MSRDNTLAAGIICMLGSFRLTSPIQCVTILIRLRIIRGGKMNRLKTVRKNLIVEGKKLEALRKILGASSESEAVRKAIDRTLTGEEVIAAFHRLRKRGTWANRYGRTAS